MRFVPFLYIDTFSLADDTILNSQSYCRENITYPPRQSRSAGESLVTCLQDRQRSSSVGRQHRKVRFPSRTKFKAVLFISYSGNTRNSLWARGLLFAEIASFQMEFKYLAHATWNKEYFVHVCISVLVVCIRCLRQLGGKRHQHSVRNAAKATS